MAYSILAQVPEPKASVAVATPVLETLWNIWRDFLGHVPLFGAGLGVIIFTALVGRLFNALSGRILRPLHLRSSIKELLRRFVFIAIWFGGLLTAAMVTFPGITPAKALTTLGLGSIAIGFAFKDIFENFFAGILLLWRFPFENGDFIECEGILGKIDDITIRNTLIRLTTGELVVVPNATLFKNPVHVLTNRKVRRVTVICGIAYSEDVDKSRGVIEGALEKCASVDNSEPIEVFAQEFAASSINFEVTWWTKATPLDIRRSRDEVVSAIKGALDNAGIEIPFPYRTLTFTEPIQSAIKNLSKND